MDLRVVDVLAVVGAEGALVGVLCGLVAGLGLGDDVNALVTLGRDTDGLLVDVSGVLRANWSVSIVRRLFAQLPQGHRWDFHQVVRTLREFLLARLRGSRENWTPPPVLRLTR